MEHHIYGCNVLTNVQHFVRGRAAFDDFLILSMNHWEATALLGNLSVDEESLMRLIHWAVEEREGISGNYALLISIDGKYGAVGLRKEIDEPNPGSEVVYIGDVHAPIRGIKAQVEKNVKFNPELAKKLNLRAFQKSVPDRIVFHPGASFGPGSASEEIREAIRNIEGATDDALVWISMLGVIPRIGLEEKVLDAANREIKMRIDKKSEFRSTFFPLNQITLREIEARGRRARRDLQRYRDKFPNEVDIDLHHEAIKLRNLEIERYCRRLSNDRLVELCVFLFNQEEWHGDSFKLVGMEFYRRIELAGDAA